MLSTLFRRSLSQSRSLETMSSLTSENAETKVGVFWDVEECPVPDGVEPSVVCENIKLALENKGYRPCNVSIRVYGERTNKFKDDFLLADIMFLPAGDEGARFMRMCNDFFCWGNDNRKSTLMVMSRDSTEFASSFVMYKNLNFNILVAQPENVDRKCPVCRKPLEMIITDEWVWESLSAGGDPLPKTQEEPDLSNSCH
ncbi:putative NYN domain, limkain-b1-type, meiosis regulator and mRNA stability factor 1 [Arabidopsis thaliana]